VKKILLLLIALALNAFAQQTSVAVLPSDTDGTGTALNDNELKALTDEMREAALKVLPTNTFVLLKQDVVVKRLGGAENYIKECMESSCIVDLGKKAQVDYVAQANVMKLGNKIRLKVELYNVRTEGLVAMFNDEASNIRSLLEIVKKKAPEVFGKIIDTSSDSKVADVSPSLPVAGDISGGYLTDSRDGKRYKFVKIGNQTWMAENLNYNANGSNCYNNNHASCQEYGMLYDWYTAKAVCPKEWHLPSKIEWNVLMKSVNPSCSDNSYCANTGTKLKATSGWNENGNGTDNYGFSALPGGRYSDGNFNSVGYYGYWWSSSESSGNYAYRRRMDYDHSDAGYGPYVKSGLFSVRCVKD